MPDFRVFTPPGETNRSEIQLSRDESHHLVVVNRARLGNTVVAFDGRGREWITELTQAAKTAAVLRVKSDRIAQPLGFEITLAQALPLGASMDGIVRKATEIGARRIVPLVSKRTQVHLEGERQEKKLEKWQTAALEAAKQCGNPWLPEIAPLQSLDSFLAGHNRADGELRLVASLHPGALPLKQLLQATRSVREPFPTKVTWLIGPEGDFTPDEIAAALQASYQPATLGPLVLRCETAATFALSVTAYELGSSS